MSKLWSHKLGTDKRLVDFGLNASIMEELGLHVMKAWEDRLYKFKARRISFKDYGEINSFGCRLNKGNFAGFTINLEDGFITFNTNGRRGKFADIITLPIDFSRENSGYAAEALKGGFGSLRKLVIVRRCIRALVAKSHKRDVP